MNIKSERDLPINNNMKYIKLPIYVSAAFIFLALVASANGFTTTTVELDFLTDNRFLANILFLGFVIAINERLIETFISTLRRRRRESIQRAIKELEADSGHDPDELKGWQDLLICYRAESRRLALAFSVFMGSSLACLGVVKVFGPLLDPTQTVTWIHVALLDTMDVFVAGWLIAGGSEGWNKLTSSIEAILDRSKQLNQ